MNPKEEKQFFKENCQRLKTGTCLTARCLKRGGYIRGKTNPYFIRRMATCEYLEIYKKIKSLEEDLENKGLEAFYD